MSHATNTIPSPEPTRAPQWKKWLSLNNRYLPPLLVTFIVFGEPLGYGTLEIYQKALLTILAAICTEMVLGRFFLGRFPNISPAYMTGVSILLFLRAPALWPYAVCASLAITSKYVLRFRGKHLWNPSAFGVSVLLFLLPASATMLSIQWGNTVGRMVIIWLIGAIVLWRVRRFHITLTYAVAFLLLAILRAYILHEPVLAEISPITSPEYQLYMLFLITDPKTTVHSKTGQYLTVIAIAVLEMIFRFHESVYAEVYALFWVGPIAMLIEIWLNGRRMKIEPAAQTLASSPQLARPRSAEGITLTTLQRKLTVSALLVTTLMVAGCKGRPPAATPESSSAARPTAELPSHIEFPQSAAPQRPSGPITFTDITRQAGIHFIHNSGAFGKKYLPETMGSGVCFIDYDNDGWQDILLVNSMDWPGHKKHASYPALYHNNHDGTFTDVTRQAGLDVEMYGMGCAVGDYDNDGYDDIYITAVGKSHLFHNMGNGTFRDVTATAGVSSPGFATSAAWFDYDHDGKLDLVVDHYVDWSIATDKTCSLDGKHKSYCTPELYKGQSIRLYHNEGNGRFKDVTKAAGIYDPSDKALGVALIDYDNDGWLDLFITNDTQPNKLYHNNHNGTFTETGFAAGVAFSDAGKARAGMGTDAADYDDSGRQSLVVGNFTNESMALYHNDGQGLFSDQAMSAGIALPSAKSLTFSAFFFDYNLDGLPDIFALNGHVADDISVIQPSLSYAEPPLLFRNLGHGKFENVSQKVGAALRQAVVGRGAAYGDIDNDGDLDLVLTSSNGPARLLRNDNGNKNDMLRVRTIGTRSNRDGIGAKVILTTSTGQRISEMVKSGSSYLSQSELPLTFGLGKPNPANRISLTILWPSGHKDRIVDIHPDQFVTVEEGKGIIRAQPINFVLKSAK